MTKNLSLRELIDQELNSEKIKLPVFNRTAHKLQEMLSQKDFNLAACADLVAKDQALAGKVLREANSSFFSGLKQITTIKNAFIRLGASEVLRLTIQVTMENQYVCRHPGLKKMSRQLWTHSLATAYASYWLAKKLGHQTIANETFIAGLTHDIGELFLLRVCDEIVASGRLKTLSESLLMEIFDSLHSELGERLMQKWNLPQEYIQVAREHHNYNLENPGSLLLLVQMADQACYKLGIGYRHEPKMVLASLPQAQQLDLRETGIAELEIMLEDKFLHPQ